MGFAALIPIATTALSAVMNAGGQEASAAGQAAQARYQAQIAVENQKIAKQNAGWIGAEGSQQVENEELKGRQQAGAITAAQGANNVDINSGSAAQVRKSADLLTQDDALTIRSNATRAAYGQELEAASDSAQSKLLGAEAANDTAAGGISAAGSLLSGASSVYSKYRAWQLAGGGGGSANGVDPSTGESATLSGGF